MHQDLHPLTARRAVRAKEIFVIVGAGQAGVQAAITLREQGFAGRVVLIGDERQAAYMRPPLSKKFLAGQTSEDRLYLRPSTYFVDADIELRTAARVQAIDRVRHQLQLDGRALPYDKLLLATGCRARQLSLPGLPDSNVHYLRTLDDSLALRAKLVPGKRLAVIGGGYVGLEVAATANQLGLEVTVFELGERLLERVTSAIVSEHIAQLHRRHGVDVRCATQVTALVSTNGQLQAVHSSAGVVATDLALVGIGAIANDELARDAGLRCEAGIVTDAFGRTDDPDIYAAGDCTRHPNALFARHLRLESVQNAVDQATVAACNMMGAELVYTRVPWFWSQQYDVKLQSAGFVDGHDEIVQRGDPASGRFALLYRRAGQIIAVDALNMPGEYLSARKTIAARGEAPTTPTAAASTIAVAAGHPQIDTTAA